MIHTPHLATDLKLVFEPKVYLVGRLTIDEAELDGFLADEGVSAWRTDAEVAAEKLVEVAGRLCYKSYAKPRPGGNAAYLGHILEVGHGSVIEHAVYNFIITGVSRSFTHELVRHRAGFAYSQRSQRFCNESEGSFVVPPALRREVDAARRFLASHDYFNATDVMEADGDMVAKHLAMHAEPSVIAAGIKWLATVERCQDSYAKLSSYLAERDAPPSPSGKRIIVTDQRKRAREAARSILPNATETQIFVTANVRAIRHFIESRGDASSDAEIRKVAIDLLRIMQAESPNLFGDYAVNTTNGVESIATPYPKV